MLPASNVLPVDIDSPTSEIMPATPKEQADNRTEEQSSDQVGTSQVATSPGNGPESRREPANEVMGRFSAAAKGKWKERADPQPPTSAQYVPVHDSSDPQYEDGPEEAPPNEHPTPSGSVSGVLGRSSVRPRAKDAQSWTKHNIPLLEVYSTPVVSTEFHKQQEHKVSGKFVTGMLRTMGSRVEGKENIPPSRQVPDTLDAYLDIATWTTDALAQRDIHRPPDRVSTIVDILLNTFTEAAISLVDSMTKSAIQSMHTRHFGVMEVNDYSQSFEFELKQTLPFASESRHSVSDGALLIPPVVRIPPEDEAPARPTTKKRKRKQTPPNSSDTAFVAPPPPKQSAWTIQRDRRDTRKGPGSSNAAPSSRVKIQAALVAPGLVENASISAPAPICGQSKQWPPLAGHTTDLPQTSAPNRPSLALASASVVAGVVANTVKVPSNSVRNSRVVSAPPTQGLLTRAAAARQALQAAETTLASTSTPA